MKLTKRLTAIAACAMLATTSMVSVKSSAANTKNISNDINYNVNYGILNVNHKGTYVNLTNASSNIQIISNSSAYLTNVNGYSGNASIFFNIPDTIKPEDVGGIVGNITINSGPSSVVGNTYPVYLHHIRLGLFDTEYYFTIIIDGIPYEQAHRVA